PGGRIRSSRGWAVASVVAILLATALFFAQPRADSHEHSSNSDAANGWSAALLFAEAVGHQTDQMTGSCTTPAPFSVLFVFTPTSPYTADEANQLTGWVRARGCLLVRGSE